ncbi:hypothetical protein ACFOQM_21150 [Paenibacillus sp. GCM10012307]|uniref:Uncharacterized protein n=1 Tax=Paenibacillus roseus TaxID=2798579 RepID=A0A934J8W8_9BACL|nr:hypothetical protein [Paenibacillus roseus]MBJ6363738.1 hypothetical protein [Paenibacillus roseus]
MTLELYIHLYQDWLATVKEIFAGSGQPLPDHATDKQVGLAYYIQNAADLEEAERLRASNEERLNEIERTIRANFEQVILPDILRQTRYAGDVFRFKWVFNQGEHIIEECSEYRISL